MHLSSITKSYLEHMTQWYLSTCLSGKNSEVSMIYSMHKTIFILGHLWNKGLKKEGKSFLTSMSSEFIHLTPKVSYNGISPKGKAIEFGDLLYLYTETDSRGRERETALLLQAKVIGNSVDQHQLALYTTWPTFWLINNSASKFDVVSSPGPHEGAKYLMLSNSVGKVNGFSLIVDPIAKLKTTASGNEFSEELVSLLDFSRGRELKGDWKKAVDDVKAYIRGMKRKSSYLPRHRNIIFFNPETHMPFISNESFDSDLKGFWFVHIKATVPYEFEEKISEE